MSRMSDLAADIEAERQDASTLAESNGFVRLNLGSGNTRIEGFENVDRMNGQEVYPLDRPDNSVDEIYASHVLEHFGHREAADVLKHWVGKLKPGGRIRIAVPDFEWIAKKYIAGEPINVQGYTMGGQTDENDFHRTIFDGETLMEAMCAAGLERLGRWTADTKDCAALPVSLNMQGFKPTLPLRTVENTTAVLSCPRFGPMMHTRMAFNALGKLAIPYQQCQGAYWHQVLCEVIEHQLADPKVEYILTLDFDTVFTPLDVLEMYRLIKSFPDVDAIIPVQAKRAQEASLFRINNADGTPKTQVYLADFNRFLTRVDTGHFGCTLFKAESLRKLPRPWMVGQPNALGRWSEKKVDPDIEFWHNWERAGFSLHMANCVVVGHLMELIGWPGQDFRPVYQTLMDWDRGGPPPDARRTIVQDFTLAPERLIANRDYLKGRERNDYSQFGEDGLIEATLEHIGATNHWCFEVGASDGVIFSNTKRLRDEGWSAVLIEADAKHESALKSYESEQVHVVIGHVGSDLTLDTILADAGAPQDLDLGIIDVDGKEYEIWEAMQTYAPRVMLVEHNPYGLGTQRSADAICKLAAKKGYVEVARTFCNCLFVRSDCDDGPEQ